MLAAIAALLASCAAAAATPVPAAADLSLDEQIGQVFMIAIDTEIAARYEPEIRAGRVGSAMLRWDRLTGAQARALAETLADWTPARAPFLLASDHEGGTMFTQRLYGATIFPGNMALGATRDAALARAAAAVSARELRAIGVRFNFAPVLDVNSSPENPIIGARSFGEDPRLVARLGTAAALGYADGGVASSLKHFPGHGDTHVDSHVGLPVSTRTSAELDAVELAPFAAAIRAKAAPSVMTAHMVFPGLGEPALPVTLSSAVIEGVLRRRLGFTGVVISDSFEMGAIADRWGAAEASVRAFEAGCDIILIGKGDFFGARDALTSAVRSGRVSRARLELSVGRVVALKRGAGLYAAPRPDLPLSELSRPRHLALARRIAESSVTLLRADPAVLPLRRAGRLVVVAVRPPAFAGELRGFFNALRKRAPAAELVELGVRPALDEIAAAAQAARGASAVLYASWSWGTTGGAEQEELGQALEDAGAPIIHAAVLNPYGLRRFPRARSALALYGASPASLEAGARLLFGEIPPRGRLPVTIPGFAPRGAGLQAFPKAVKTGAGRARDGQQR